MVAEIISLSISAKVWDRAGIKLATLDLQTDTFLQSDMLPTALSSPVYFHLKSNENDPLALKIARLNKGVVTVQDSQSGKSFSSILNLAKNVQKSPIKWLKEQNIHRKQLVYAYLIVNI